MQYNISGFNQECLLLFRKTEYSVIANKKTGKDEVKRVELKIDSTDIHLLNWFIDLWFSESKLRFARHRNPKDGLEYVNIHYSKTQNNFPVLFENPRMARKSFMKLTYFGILKHYHHLNKGSYSCFRPNEEVISLIRYKDRQVTDLEYAENKKRLIEEILIPNNILYGAVNLPSTHRCRGVYL